MADPVSWALMAKAALDVTGELVGGVQGYQQGMYESAVAGQNATIAQENAARARRDADLAEEAHRLNMRKELGRAAAAAAQSGAAGSGPGQGSVGAVLTQGAKLAELDALNIRYGGDTERGAYLVEAANYTAERRAAIRRAKGAAIGGVLGAASKGLSGYSDYKGYRAQRRLSTPAPITPRAPRPQPYHSRVPR